MTGLWAFRLFTNTSENDGITPEPEASLAQVIESGAFKIDLSRRTASLGEQKLELNVRGV